MSQFLRHISVAFGFVAEIAVCHSQTSWLESENCHINARTSDDRFEGRADVIDATFKWYVYLSGTAVECTGVLMNRRVDQEDLGFYFSTARHCINPDIDLNADHVFMFHYESHTGVTADTKPSNQGQAFVQSNRINPFLPSQKGFECLHRSKVELVKESIMADYALLRMVTPPPPHFDLYFSGWQPHSAFLPPNVPVLFPCGLWHVHVMPNTPTMLDTLGVRLYALELDSSMAIAVHFIQDVLPDTTLGSLYQSAFDVEGDTLRAMAQVMLAVSYGELLAIADTVVNGVPHLDLAFAVQEQEDAEPQLLHARLYYWNRRFITFSVTAAYRDATEVAMLAQELRSTIHISAL